MLLMKPQHLQIETKLLYFTNLSNEVECLECPRPYPVVGEMDDNPGGFASFSLFMQPYTYRFLFHK